jgi:hypothetical protein
LNLSPDTADASWTDAIRKKTPPATVIVVNHPEFHTTSFTARSLLVPSEGVKRHFGYNMDSQFNLLVERGYSRDLFENRYKLLEKIYAAEPGDMKQVLNQLMALKRPIAIVVRPDDGRAFLGWLRVNRVGVDLFSDDDGRAVYLISPWQG